MKIKNGLFRVSASCPKLDKKNLSHAKKRIHIINYIKPVR